MEKKSALLVGVGGQGAILTAKVLVNGLMKAGFDVKMSEVHGMSQRGGSVSTQVHWGEKVYSPVIGQGAADIIVAFEKMEAVRYADYLKPNGVAVINDYEIVSSTIATGAAEYPAGCLEAMQENFACYTLNAAKIAEDLGSAKCMNIVLFGAMTAALKMDDIDWEAVIAETVPEDTFLLGCTAPFMPSIGLVDGVRSSCDIFGDWASLKETMLRTLKRFYYHKRFG